jgi:hypothetical protein
MKKIFVGLLGLITITTQAQNLKTVKKAFEANDFAAAKTAVEDWVTKEPNKADSWYWKHKVYQTIATTPAATALEPNAMLIGFEAVKKYNSLDKDLKMMIGENITNPTGPIEAYYNKFRIDGSANLEALKYDAAIENFKNAIKVSQFFYEKKWTTAVLDTVMNFYTGYAGMKGNNNEVAETYFKKIADANASGVDLQIAYGWLANHYLNTKKDIAAAEAMIEKGLKLYATDEYLLSLKNQSIEGSGNSDKIFANDEANIAKPDATFSNYLTYGSHLYDYLYTDSLPKADAAEKAKKLEDVMTKGLTMKPNSVEGNFLMGMIHTQKTITIDAAIKKLKGKTTPADVEAKKKLNADKLALADLALKNFSFVSSVYRSKADKLKPEEKQRYKIILQNMKYFYSYKKEDAKAAELEETIKELGN